MTGGLDVVVAVRDGAAHLPTFLASARRNVAPGIRFVVVDDASRDGTADVLEAADDLPLDVVRGTEHRGVAASRNVALERCDARFVTFVDVDDWCAPGHLPALLTHAERVGAGMLRTDHVRVDGLRRTPERAPWDGPRGVVVPGRAGIGDAGGRALVDYPYLWAAVLDRTQVAPGLLRFDEDLRTAADRPWFWRLHLADVTCAVVDSPGYFYRRSAGSGSLTQSGEDRLLDFLPAYHRILDQALADGDLVVERRAVYGACRIVDFHVAKRDRLRPRLRRQLLAGAALLLARGSDEAFAAGVAGVPASGRRVLRGLREVGAAADAGAAA
ncbi:glycosyltransferase family 2 protein [Cellulomonas sp. DKR-3]|uniref:Glycosyltransferase family 2 protein n=1 Tax=Cellulomonas fulva TaxID=2835530 RepID=A0ABS5TZV8_9CELL|nr:glycosyltransferase family 2 protein [Cellulomonas fulva]MBT0994586.1 glycosyltransferase family 2 protein [Cellulomonas fulva]